MKNLVQVKNNSVGVSAKKMRPIVNLIRNKSAKEALGILRFCEKKEISILLSKLINSGLTIAETGGTQDLTNLKIHQIFVDEGKTLKRIMPRAQGRAFRINKRSSKVTLQLKEE
jgi:large subunit ribosomal protein L22